MMLLIVALWLSAGPGPDYAVATYNTFVGHHDNDNAGFIVEYTTGIPLQINSCYPLGFRRFGVRLECRTLYRRLDGFYSRPPAPAPEREIFYPRFRSMLTNIDARLRFLRGIVRGLKGRGPL